MIYRSVTLSIETIGLKMIQMSGKKTEFLRVGAFAALFWLRIVKSTIM